MNFCLQARPVLGPLLDPGTGSGAVVTFEGRVRDLNANRAVTALEYEAFDELAVKTGQSIIDSALTRFPIHDAACVHAVGRLELGDIAIRVEVAGPHRGESFAACRWILDEVKRLVPIWKKEFYREGDSGWINAVPGIEANEANYYSRQTILPQVDQERLKSARVLIVGAGGLGCPAISYLAGAGVGHLTIIDSDTLEESNLHRQVSFKHADLGQSKARLAAQRASDLNPYIHAVGEQIRIGRAEAEALVRDHDLVLDCTDNFLTKFMLNDASVRIGRPLITASIYQFEGQLTLIQPAGPCLRCLWPTAPDEGCVGSCAETGVLGVLPGFFGTLQATEAIKLLLGVPSPLQQGRMLIADLLTLESHSLAFPIGPSCPACGTGVPALDIEVLDPQGTVVDIRERHEAKLAEIEGAICMPYSEFDAERLPPSDQYVLVCTRGHFSGHLARTLRDAGDPRFFSLSGGASRLAACLSLTSERTDRRRWSTFPEKPLPNAEPSAADSSD